MLVLGLQPNNVISIDTPEGVVRITACAPPRCFRVAPCEGQSLRALAATAGELAHGGAKRWVVVDSAAGRIRVRRVPWKSASSPSPRPAAPPPADGAEPPRKPPGVMRCRIAIDAPRYMAVWRESIGQEHCEEPHEDAP